MPIIALFLFASAACTYDSGPDPNSVSKISRASLDKWGVTEPDAAMLQQAVHEGINKNYKFHRNSLGTKSTKLDCATAGVEHPGGVRDIECVSPMYEVLDKEYSDPSVYETRSGEVERFDVVEAKLGEFKYPADLLPPAEAPADFTYYAAKVNVLRRGQYNHISYGPGQRNRKEDASTTTRDFVAIVVCLEWDAATRSWKHRRLAEWEERSLFPNPWPGG